MKYIVEFMNQYGVAFIHSIAVAIISYVSIEIKKVYKKYINDKTKKDVINTVCQAINQLYPSLTNEEKLNKVILNSGEILKEKGIIISDLELRMYIESAVNSFKVGDVKWQ